MCDLPYSYDNELKSGKVRHQPKTSLKPAHRIPKDKNPETPCEHGKLNGY
jgi:hypothetical protein